MDPNAIAQWLALIAQIVAMLKQIGVIPAAPTNPTAEETSIDHNEVALWMLAAQIATASAGKKS